MSNDSGGRYFGEGANGGCFFNIEPSETDGMARVDVGWSCVGVHDGEMPVTWLTEIIAIATEHEGGIAGFLKDHYGEQSYALMCDPPAQGE